VCVSEAECPPSHHALTIYYNFAYRPYRRRKKQLGVCRRFLSDSLVPIFSAKSCRSTSAPAPPARRDGAPALGVEWALWWFVSSSPAPRCECSLLARSCTVYVFLVYVLHVCAGVVTAFSFFKIERPSNTFYSEHTLCFSEYLPCVTRAGTLDSNRMHSIQATHSSI
jgi:hypothetical protein